MVVGRGGQEEGLIFRAQNTLNATTIMNTRHYVFVQTHIMYNTNSDHM